MRVQRLHFLAASFALLLWIVFGRALFLLGSESSLVGVAQNLTLVLGGAFLVGLLLFWVLTLVRKSSKLDFVSALKNSLILAGVIIFFYYGYAIWFWDWPSNDQKGQPMYYENYSHWFGFLILAGSIALWIFWNRKLSKEKQHLNQGE